MNIRIYLIALTSLVLVGCGGNSDNARNLGNRIQPPPVVTTQTGVFFDAPVSGLTFHTETLSGTTDASGEFNYVEGETIRFELAGIDLGEAPAQSILTPLDLYPRRPQYQVALMSFLQTLDSDSDPSNGIEINETTRNTLSDFVQLDQRSSSFPFTVSRNDYVDLAGAVSNRSEWLDEQAALDAFESEIQPMVDTGEYERPNDMPRPATMFAVETGNTDIPAVYINKFGDTIGVLVDADTRELNGLYLKSPDSIELVVEQSTETVLSISDGTSILTIDRTSETEFRTYLTQNGVTTELIESDLSNVSTNAGHGKQVSISKAGSVGTAAFVGAPQLVNCSQPNANPLSGEFVNECVVGGLRGVAETVEFILERLPASGNEIGRQLLSNWKSALFSGAISLSDEIDFVQENGLDTAVGIALDAAACPTSGVACFSAIAQTAFQTYEAIRLSIEILQDEAFCPDPAGIGLVVCADFVPLLASSATIEVETGVNLIDLSSLEPLLIAGDPLENDFIFNIETSDAQIDAQILLDQYTLRVVIPDNAIPSSMFEVVLKANYEGIEIFSNLATIELTVPGPEQDEPPGSDDSLVGTWIIEVVSRQRDPSSERCPSADPLPSFDRAEISREGDSFTVDFYIDNTCRTYNGSTELAAGSVLPVPTEFRFETEEVYAEIRAGRLGPCGFSSVSIRPPDEYSDAYPSFETGFFSNGIFEGSGSTSVVIGPNIGPQVCRDNYVYEGRKAD